MRGGRRSEASSSANRDSRALARVRTSVRPSAVAASGATPITVAGSAQRPGSRLLTPMGPTDDAPPTLLDAGPLYAGETVRRIDAIRPAADLVASLTP